MKLSVFVVTYNQEQYIRQCLDSIVMQQVDFDYEVIIGEDCSIDNTPQICDEYADKYSFIHVFHHSKNLGLVKNWEFVLNKCIGEYVAMIEGDDYWTNPRKLQTQVDYLEAHKDCQICFYKPSVVFTDDVAEKQIQQEKVMFDHLRPRSYYRRDIYGKWAILTSTVVFRNSLKQYYFPSDVFITDYYLFLSLMEKGTADCIDFVGTAYRRTSDNYSSQYSYEICCKLYNQYHYYVNIFPDLKDISKSICNEYLRGIIYDKKNYDTWKYRFHYMWLNKKLLFSPFFVTTLTKYMLKPYLEQILNKINSI